MISTISVLDTKPSVSSEGHNCRYGCRHVCEFDKICPGDAVRVLKPKGNSLVLPGTAPTKVYFVHEGLIGLFRSWSTGEETIVAIHGPGDTFGGTAFLEGWLPRPGQFLGHIKTLTAVRLCHLEPATFLDYVSKGPDRAKRALQLLTMITREHDRMATLPIRRGPGKALAHVLAVLAEKTGQNTRNGLVLCSYFTHQDLADMARLGRSNATRALHELAGRGLIDLRRNQITVIDLDKLWAFIDEEGEP